MNLSDEELALIEKHRRRSENSKLRAEKQAAAKVAQEAIRAKENQARAEGQAVLEAFCEELDALCLKYGVGIGGGEGAEAWVEVRGVWAIRDISR